MVALTETGPVLVAMMSADSMIGNPIHPLTLRTVPDKSYVPSDCQMTRPLTREECRFRTQMLKERDMNRPRILYRIIHSPFGEVLKAIRENEPRAVSLGYKTDRYKLVAFVLSATLAGLAGSTKAIVLQIASLTDVNWPMSGEVVLMALVGGLGLAPGLCAGHHKAMAQG